MTTEIDTQSEPSESRKPLRFLVVVLATGITITVSAVVAQNRSPSGILPIALTYVDGIVSLFVIATTVEMARERSPRTLLMISLAIMATPFLAAALVASFMSGHHSAPFGLIYFIWACVASGLSLLIVAGVRFVKERRKQRLSANE
jgi:hypothetical protein